MKKKRAKAKKKKSGLLSLRYLLPAGFFLALSVFLLLLTPYTISQPDLNLSIISSTAFISS